MLRYKEVKLMLMDLMAEMKNGDRLPSRPTLSRKLDSSRATIDKACRELEEEGALQCRFGSGTYVYRKLEGVVSNVENWCLIISDYSESIYASLACGVMSVAQDRNANVILFNSENNAEKQANYIQQLIQAGGVDGFVIVPAITRTATENMGLYRNLCCSQIPFVFCNREVDGVFAPIVKSNDFYGGYIATQHLIAQGYRSIVFLAHQRYRTSIDRCHGYISALQQCNININRKNILLLNNSTIEACTHELVQLLRSGDAVDAVFCFNDFIALELLHHLKASGIRVPDDIGIMGYDNIDACMSSDPPLTTVAYKFEDIGRMAARVLGKMVDGQALDGFAYYLMEPEIMVRASC